MATQSDHVSAAEELHAHSPIPDDARRLAFDTTLTNGAVMHVRAVRGDDKERLQAFHSRLSLDTIVFRFFRVLPELSDADARAFTHIDYENRMAVVATVDTDAGEQIIGVVRYERIGPDTGEVAFVVEDNWQGMGIAPRLLHVLADYARHRGFSTLVAITMGNNRHMLNMLHHSEFPSTTHYTGGEVTVRLSITETETRPV